MFRSHGELRSYAQRVFALYGSEGGTLSASQFRLAWYILWGKFPDTNILRLVFDASETTLEDDTKCAGRVHDPGIGNAADAKGCNGFTDVSDVPRCFPSRQRKEISEGEFVRFAAAYFDSLGAETAVVGDAEIASDARAAVVRTAQWAHFESLAGEKGYVTFDDILAADRVEWLCCPANKVAAISGGVEQVDKKSVAVECGNDGRVALLSHAFAITDSDGDGRIVFSDMERYLTPVFP